MGFTNYLEAKVLNDNFSSVELALFTSEPGEDDTGIEVTGGGYERQAIVFGSASGGEITNTAEVRFPIATADYGAVTHMGIYDASGNLLDYIILEEYDESKEMLVPAPREVHTNDQFVLDRYTVKLD